jgi:transcriptional regulator of nitric oxide reductase
LDHVEARVLKRNESGVLIQITNPTKLDANVAVFAETDQQSKKPLPVNAFTKWPKVEIKTGQTVTVRVTKNGQIENQNTSPSLY